MNLRPPLRSVLDTLESEDRLSERDRDALRDAAPSYAGTAATPWYLHAVMVGVSWIAAPCIALAPFGMTNSDEAHLAFGIVGCVAACVARRFLHHPLVAHLLLAFSIVFQLDTVVGLIEVVNDDTAAAVLSAALFTVLFFVYPDPVHRVVVVLGALASTAVAGVQGDVPHVLELHAVVTLFAAGALWAPATPRMLGRAGELARPAGIALLTAGLVFAALTGTDVLRAEIEPEVEGTIQPLLSGIPLWAGLLALVAVRLRQHGVRLTGGAALGTLGGLAAIAVLSPERAMLPAALGGLLLAFHARDVVGVPLAILGLLWELVWLWVNTDLPALPRAFSLLGAGAVLLAVWYGWQRGTAKPAGRGT